MRKGLAPKIFPPRFEGGPPDISTAENSLKNDSACFSKRLFLPFSPLSSVAFALVYELSDQAAIVREGHLPVLKHGIIRIFGENEVRHVV